MCGVEGYNPDTGKPSIIKCGQGRILKFALSGFIIIFELCF